MRKIIKPFKYLLSKLKILIMSAITKVRESIRIQLLTTFILCVFLGLLVARATLPYVGNSIPTIDYSGDMQRINFQAQQAADLAVSENSVETILQMIEAENEKLKLAEQALKVLVTDEHGKVLYKTKQAEEEQIDVHNKIRHVMDFAINYPLYNFNYDIPAVEQSQKEIIAFYPITIEDENLYLFVSGIPSGVLIKSITEGPVPVLIGFAVFTLSFLYLTKRKMKQIESLAKGVKEIAKGDLSYRIEKKGIDEIALLTENVNHMAEAIMTNIEMERRIEKQKNELITNVSHDLRTPLTSIMGYLRLLRDERYDTKEQYDEYLKIAFSKSEQLKNLIEDLFEYTKLTNDSIVLGQQDICINELLDQLIEELIPQAEENHRTFNKNFSEERIFATVDSEKIVRVFDNLLMNAIKYSTGGGEIFVSLERKEDHVQICFANESNEFTSEELMSLFERFYKKDQSRTSVAEGSGLGLAIAKSIVELHGGKIDAKYTDDMLQFIIELPVTTL